MFTEKRIFWSLLIAMTIAVVLLTNNSIKTSQKIKTVEAENALLALEVSEKKEQIELLSIHLEQANEVIAIQKPVVEQFKQLSQFIDFDAFDMTQLETVMKISEETPLDYEGALALVKYADLYDLPYSLVLSIIDLESNFNPNLVGTSQDRGYMQIIPATERWLVHQFGDELGIEYDPGRIFEPEYNLALGIKYLDLLRSNHGDDYDRILSEYNRGPSNLARYYSAYQTYSTSYSRTVLSRQKKYLALNN